MNKEVSDRDELITAFSFHLYNALVETNTPLNPVVIFTGKEMWVSLKPPSGNDMVVNGAVFQGAGGRFKLPKNTQQAEELAVTLVASIRSGLRHVPDRYIAARKMPKFLEDGFILFLSEPDKLAKGLQEAGFKTRIIEPQNRTVN